ncbi:MAG: glucose-1-phosphate cytidylyltransferase [Planctomycetes bacterium]|nr:glucose-1-phosphate cytidylyltransferase [Planctomycetota bacterium]
MQLPRQAVILCGGMGTRLREETEYKPKPLVAVGDMPILWHIMKHYAHFGVREFILCLGYKGHLIKEFFLNYEWMSNDFALELGRQRNRIINLQHPPEDWRIVFADTGLQTPTGGRVHKIRKYVTGPEFFLTYGDGVSNVDLAELYEKHRRMKCVATLTAVHPTSPFGIIEATDGVARSFKEKPRLEGIINGGFFVFGRRIFDYLKDDAVLEEEPLRALAAESQLAVYEHRDFWMCMDTFKDVERLNKMWAEGNRPWAAWTK